MQACLVPALFTFLIQDVLKFKRKFRRQMVKEILTCSTNIIPGDVIRKKSNCLIIRNLASNSEVQV
jgi:hypothetical protein